MQSLYRHFGSSLMALLLLVLALGVHAQGTQEVGKKNVVVLRTASLEEILALRCTAPELRYELPSTGIVSAKAGSTVLIHEGKAVVSVQPQTSKDIKSTALAGDKPRLSTIELRVIGRNIYLSRAVEKIEVIDITGRVVQTHLHARYASLSSLRNGTYLLRLLSERDQIVSKIILQ